MIGSTAATLMPQAMRKVRGDARLEGLDLEQQACVHIWLEEQNLSYTRVAELVAAKFGVAVSKSAVGAYWQRHCIRAGHHAQVEAANALAKLPLAQFSGATLNRARLLAYELLVCRDPQIDPAARLLEIIRRADQQEISRERLALDRERLALRREELTARPARHRPTGPARRTRTPAPPLPQNKPLLTPPAAASSAGESTEPATSSPDARPRPLDPDPTPATPFDLEDVAEILSQPDAPDPYLPSSDPEPFPSYSTPTDTQDASPTPSSAPPPCPLTSPSPLPPPATPDSSFASVQSAPTPSPLFASAPPSDPPLFPASSSLVQPPNSHQTPAPAVASAKAESPPFAIPPIPTIPSSPPVDAPPSASTPTLALSPLPNRSSPPATSPAHSAGPRATANARPTPGSPPAWLTALASRL